MKKSHMNYSGTHTQEDPVLALYCNSKVKLEKNLAVIEEDGMVTVELLIVLALFCAIALLWNLFGTEITAFFTKVISSIKNVRTSIQ